MQDVSETPESFKLLAYFYNNMQLSITNCHADLFNTAYEGYELTVANQYLCKTRLARITPKKIGQFVTLWKKDKTVNVPLNDEDLSDFLIITVKHKQQIGQFVFPKQVLLDKQILHSKTALGKMGFRVYPNWDTPKAKQAILTQRWQLLYFIDLTQQTAANLTALQDLFYYSPLK